MKIIEIIATKEGTNGILPSGRNTDYDIDDDELEDDGADKKELGAKWEYWAGGLSPG